MRRRLTSELAASVLMIISLVTLPIRTQVLHKFDSEVKQQVKQVNFETPKFALLVGINKYKATKEVNPLLGSENDADLMFDLLVQDYGFDPKNIKVLKGEGASKEKLATADNIRSGFKWLIEKAAESKKVGNEAIVIFYYSGHGSQVSNQSDDKYDELDDDKDETIVPYDSRQGNVYDMRDDELDDYYAELSTHTPNITLILDSCHSGTASRGDENMVARLASDDIRPQPYYKRKYHLTTQDRIGKFVTLSAATSYQRAYERDKRRPNEPHNGVFTYYLVQALKRASRATTYRELIQEVSIGVKSEIPSGQDPQSEGNIDSYVFGSAAKRAEPFITVLHVNREKGEVTFNAGQVHGVKPGSMIAIYTGSATSYAGVEGFLTNAVVKEKSVKVGTAVAILPKPASADEAKKIKQVNKLSKVILLSPNFGGGALRVDLSNIETLKNRSTNASLKDEIARSLNDMRLIESDLVKITRGYDAESPDENDSPLIMLKKEKFGYVFPKEDMLPPLKDEEFCAPPVKPAVDEEILYLDDGTGRALFGYYIRPNQADAYDIAKIIDLYARQRNLLALSNNSSKLGGNIHVTLAYIPGNFTKKCENGQPVRNFNEDSQRRPQLLFDSLQNQPRIRTELGLNQVFELRIKNISKQIAYVTAILVGTDGSIEIIYPDGGNAEASLLKPGNEASIGRRVTTAPLGAEKYIIFITKKPTGFSFLVTQGVRRNKGDSSMLEKILTRSGTISSRSEAIGDSPDQWATIKLELVVAENTGATGQN